MVDALLADDALVASIAEDRIAALIRRGDLVPRDRIRVGNAMELAPLGLEQAARAVLGAVVDDDGLDDDLFDAVRSLRKILDDPIPEFAPFHPELTDEEPPDGGLLDVAVDAGTDDPEPVEPEAPGAAEPAIEATEAQPTVTVDQAFVCIACGTIINTEAALISQARWRLVLCPTHHQVGDVVKKALKDHPDWTGDQIAEHLDTMEKANDAA
jgi:hypothetical protein